jgi:WD40 repeat-containing protein SMU1
MSASKSKRGHLSVPASEVVTLIQHYLTENGLTSSSAALLAETNTGTKGLLQHAHTHLKALISQGDWGSVLEILSGITLDGGSSNQGVGAKQHQLKKILAQVHEMAILELADAAEMDLAFASLKMCRDLLDKGQEKKGDGEQSIDSNIGSDGVSSTSVERRLHAVNAMRSVRAAAVASTTYDNDTDAKEMLVPPDYYGPNNVTKEKRRISIAKSIGDIIPIIPSSRLVSLCQQAIKWQIHTGEMPIVRELCEDGNNEIESEADMNGKDKKKRKKSKQTQRPRKRFDLVMGEVNVENATRDILKVSSGKRAKSGVGYERIPLDPYSTLKFGKKTQVTSCIFFTDTNANQTSLITGTSDGFIEIWDAESKYTKLRMDLDYQKNDEIMCHAGDEDDDEAPLPSILAMAVNADGTMLGSGDSFGSIFVWNIKTGLCLCEFDKVHGGAITCMDFSPDGSRIISGSQDGTCREFGLRTKRMLKEFRGHKSFVNSCHYVLSLKSLNQELLVVTASADSTVRVWCGKTAEEKYALNPMTPNGSSAVISSTSTSSSNAEKHADLDRNIHTVIPLHTPANTMILIPRGPKAMLVTVSGLILKTFENESVISTNNDVDSNTKSGKGDFITGAVSGSNKWLYLVTDGGVCHCFDVESGSVEQTIHDFGTETTGKPDIEVSELVHHPLKGHLAAFSSSKAQKRGLVTIWK